MSDLIKKDLGTVSAYKYARLHGYTGTEDEFGVLMASYASVAQEASRSASSAAEAAQLATNEAKRATQSATNAHTDAETATTAKDDTISAKNDAVSAKDTTITTKNEVAEIKKAVDSAKQVAIDQAKDSEAWATGQRDGTDVPDTDETFHNNAKYYNSLAASYATTAQSVSQAIQDMNVEAVTLEPDFDATIEKIVNSETGVITLKYGIPKGAKGRITFSDDGTGNIVIQ